MASKRIHSRNAYTSELKKLRIIRTFETVNILENTILPTVLNRIIIGYLSDLYDQDMKVIASMCMIRFKLWNDLSYAFLVVPKVNRTLVNLYGNVPISRNCNCQEKEEATVCRCERQFGRLFDILAILNRVRRQSKGGPLSDDEENDDEDNDIREEGEPL